MVLTHRCEKSLKHGVSIRFCKESESFDLDGDYKTWRLFALEYNFEYNIKYLNHISAIDFCPFCGERLIDKN